MRGRLASRLSAAAVAALAVPWTASAQQSAAPSIEPGQRVQELDLIGEIVYDSNVAATSAALASARGLYAGDEIFGPKLHFVVARPIGRETVYVLGDAGYDFHVRNTILNRENIDIQPGVLGQVGPCQTGLNGEYSRAQSDLAELATSPAGFSSIAQQRNVLQVEEVGGNASCVRSTGFGPSVTASETWTQNSSPVERYIDAQTFSGSGGLTYQRPVLGSIRAFGAYSQTDYPNRAGLAGFRGASAANGFQTVSGGLTYTRAIGSRLQGSASLSYTKLSEKGSAAGLASGGFSGLTYSAALSYLLTSRLTATGAVSRATVPSNRLNSTFGLEELYSGALNYTPSSRLTVTGGASVTRNTYNGVPYPLGFDLTDEKIYSVFGDVNFRFTGRLSLGLDVRHSQRDVNFPGFSYPETRVGLTARATF